MVRLSPVSISMPPTLRLGSSCGGSTQIRGGPPVMPGSPLLEPRSIGSITKGVATTPTMYTLTQEPSLVRSEEHTSELQSLMRISYAVFCLKKKKNQDNKTI